MRLSLVRWYVLLLNFFSVGSHEALTVDQKSLQTDSNRHTSLTKTEYCHCTIEAYCWSLPGPAQSNGLGVYQEEYYLSPRYNKIII